MKKETFFKFDAEGNALPYYGNTVISFLNTEDQPVFCAARDVQQEMMHTGFAQNVAFVPADSFHMTVLNLCREIDRDEPDWPKNISRTARFPQIDRALQEIVSRVPWPEDIRMEVARCNVANVELRCADRESLEKIQTYRARLADETGIHHPWHDTFRFHITLNYLLRPLDEQQQAEADAFCEAATQRLLRDVPPFLAPPAQFVIFNDMMSYHADLRLRGELY